MRERSLPFSRLSKANATFLLVLMMILALCLNQIRVGLSQYSSQHELATKLDSFILHPNTIAISTVHAKTVEITNNKTINHQHNNANKEKAANVTSTTSRKEALTSPRLPLFQKGKGGLVIFYHVAKTGGTTIRELFSQSKPKHFVYKKYTNKMRKKFRTQGGACNPRGANYYDHRRHILNHTKFHRNKKILLLEIHGGTPGLEIMAPYIQKLRKASLEHNKPFFAFTLVRDPLPFTISYFKFYHGKGCKYDWCEHGSYAINEKNLLASAQVHPNQQCFLLKHLSAIEGMHPSFYEKCRVTADDCNNLYTTMKSTLDWIGTTERLSVDTLPLLYQMLGLRNKIKNAKVAKTRPFQKHLSNLTIAMLSETSSMDQAIYDQVTSDYRLADIFPGIVHS